MRAIFISSLAAMCCTCCAFGAAPDSVAGTVYFEESVTSVRSNVAFGHLLQPDGTYRGIFSVRTYGPLAVQNPTDGTWTYRKLDSLTGELTFSGSLGLRILTFQDESRGTLLGSGFLTGTFRLTSPADVTPLVNCSNRAFVQPGGVAITGFVVTESVNRVLIRAVGPGLRAFDVETVLANPLLKLFQEQMVIAENQGWSSSTGAESLRRSAAFAGAFPLDEGSSDAAIIAILPPGNYTAHASGFAAGDSGEVLVEVYLLR